MFCHRLISCILNMWHDLGRVYSSNSSPLLPSVFSPSLSDSYLKTFAAIFLFKDTDSIDLISVGVNQVHFHKVFSFFVFTEKHLK